MDKHQAQYMTSNNYLKATLTFAGIALILLVIIIFEHEVTTWIFILGTILSTILAFTFFHFFMKEKTRWNTLWGIESNDIIDIDNPNSSFHELKEAWCEVRSIIVYETQGKKNSTPEYEVYFDAGERRYLLKLSYPRENECPTGKNPDEYKLKIVNNAKRILTSQVFKITAGGDVIQMVNGNEQVRFFYQWNFGDVKRINDLKETNFSEPNYWAM